MSNDSSKDLYERLQQFRDSGHLHVPDPEQRSLFWFSVACSPALGFERGAEDPKWIVEVFDPLDNSFASTLSVHEWIAKTTSATSLPAAHSDSLSEGEAWWQLLGAFAHLNSSRKLDGEQLRHEPRVGYDPVSDSAYFIFKMQNDGVTYVVSRRGIQTRI